MSEHVRAPTPAEATLTQVESEDDHNQQQDVHTVRLKLRKPKPVKKVQWRSGTVDNEHMNRRKSKCCCVYEKPRVFGESSSESEDEECENCHGHVERRSNSQTPPEDTASGSADNGSAADLT